MYVVAGKRMVGRDWWFVNKTSSAANNQQNKQSRGHNQQLRLNPNPSTVKTTRGNVIISRKP